MCDRTPQRILLIRPSALGDVVRTVPVLVSLRQAYPQARIDWLVQDNYAPAIAGHPALSGVVPFPRKQLSHWYKPGSGMNQAWQWVRQLRTQKYDAVFDLQGLARSGFITRLTGARQRIGFAKARELAWLGYNQRYPVDAKLHTVERMLGLLTAHGLPVVRDMRLYPAPVDQQWLQKYRSENGLNEQPYVIVAPTAQWLCKCWPIEKFIALARLMHSSLQPTPRLVILAAPHERTYIQPMLDALAKVNPLCPTTTVGQMLALVSQCRLLVCNDSAPLHMGVGFGKPLVALFGPTDPALVGPYQRPDTVLQPPQLPTNLDLRRYRHHREDQSLIGRIEVEGVWGKVQKQWMMDHG